MGRNSAATDYLNTMGVFFEAGGTLATSVKAGAVVRAGIAGYETLVAAKKSAAQDLRSLHNTMICSVGRYVCNKPQEDGFGKVTAEDLNDIHVFFLRLLKEKSGEAVRPEMTRSLGLHAEAPSSETKRGEEREEEEEEGSGRR